MASNQHITITVVNIQSLSTNIDLLRNYLQDSNIHPPAMFALVEAQLPASTINQYKITDYNAFHSPSEACSQQSSTVHRGTPGGGTVVYFHSSVSWRHLSQLSLTHLGPLDNDPDCGRTSSVHSS